MGQTTVDESMLAQLRAAAQPWTDFYRARAAITRHLIREHGFNIVAVEADWPDAAAVDRLIGGRGSVDAPYPAFERFPTWMWRNTDVADFVRWLAEHNVRQPPARQTRFYGLDIYSMAQSMAAVLAYLDNVDHEAAGIARQRYGCLDPWRQDPAAYGMAVLTRRHEDCEQAVMAQLRELLEKRLDYAGRICAMRTQVCVNAWKRLGWNASSASSIALRPNGKVITQKLHCPSSSTRTCGWTRRTPSSPCPGRRALARRRHGLSAYKK